MPEPLFIAGDWGTSVMRLYLCRMQDDHPAVQAHVTGPGIKAGGDFEAALFDAAAPWLARHGMLPIVLGGMIGSTIGWRNVPYVACPASSSAVAAGAERFTARGTGIVIAPGLSCTNLFGLPDVLRGEEVQMLGWLAGARPPPGRRHLTCLPGTHAKWVFTVGDRIEGFFTGMQGELHEVLLGHSVLGRSVGEHVGAFDPAGFADGIGRMRSQPMLALEHALFSVRSRIVLGDLEPEAGAAYLSGLLIGADVRDALAVCAARSLAVSSVVLIGNDRLVPLYAEAVAAFSADAPLPVVCVRAEDASVAGLAALLHA